MDEPVLSGRERRILAQIEARLRSDSRLLDRELRTMRLYRPRRPRLTVQLVLGGLGVLVAVSGVMLAAGVVLARPLLIGSVIGFWAGGLVVLLRHR